MENIRYSDAYGFSVRMNLSDAYVVAMNGVKKNEKEKEREGKWETVSFINDLRCLLCVNTY